MRNTPKRLLMIPYILLIFAPIAITTTFICAIATLIMLPIFGDSQWGYYPGRVWARVLMCAALVKIRIVGNNHFDKEKSFIFVANHQSIFDIFLIYGWLNTKFKWIMKRELRKIPLVGYTCDKMGHIFIDRTSPLKAQHSINLAEEKLRHGASIVIFPEGTRTHDGSVGSFKRGAVMIAKDLRLPIVPMTISGAYEVMPRQTLLFTPGVITLTIHPIIEQKIVNKSDINEIIHQLKEAVEAPTHKKQDISDTETNK